MPTNPFNIWDPSPTETFHCLIFRSGNISGGYSSMRYLKFSLEFQKRNSPELLDHIVAIGHVTINKEKHLKSIGFK